MTLKNSSAGDPPTPATTELRLAARFSGVAEVEVLLKAGADVNAKGTDGSTPLHEAAANNTSPVLEALLKGGAKVNAKNALGMTPLHLAAWFNPSLAVLEVLLNARADPRAIDNSGKTPRDMAKNPVYRDILWKAMRNKPLK
jgi:ankyrin repeat protein